MRGALLFLCVVGASCQMQSCPSTPGGKCNPRGANCPKDYVCAMAEICTRTCEQTSDCWVKVTDGCRYDGYLPGELLPDGGVFTDQVSDDGFCPESKLMTCQGGYCQRFVCEDGGCDYDLYGPSEYKGNRSQGPMQ